ncbi:transmembrane protein 272-like [Pleurodeles waltl]|uniref:transmembrane protein 272-like n=1 Tax=Pleurodeles waltl TaxID=8319 RepID=UPI003709916D
MTQDRTQQDCQEQSVSQMMCCASKCMKILMSLISLVWIALAIAEIVIGSVYLNSCVNQPYIPIYLIVNGVTVILISILSMVSAFRPNKFVLSLLTLLSLFWFAWLITGSVWTFPLYPDFSPCNRVVYLFTFSILIIQWIILGLSLPMIIIKLFTMCSSCSSCSSCSRCSSCGCCSFLTKY